MRSALRYQPVKAPQRDALLDYIVCILPSCYAIKRELQVLIIADTLVSGVTNIEVEPRNLIPRARMRDGAIF